MLYDNALLVMAYLEGYQASGREDFARVAREVLRYVERDMTSYVCEQRVCRFPTTDPEVSRS
jgi:uncharacterized protein YyaL (SSP411 family)